MPKLLRIFASAGTLFVFGLPLLWMASTSLKSAAEFTRNPWWFPASPTFINYSRVISDSTILNFFVNSLLVGIGSVLLTLALAAPAAYALARFPFRGRRAVEIVLLLGLTIPVHITLLPLLRLTATMHLSDGLFGLSLVYAAFGTALTVFLLKTAFQQVPRELEEAAMLDGCGRFRTFMLISLPLIRPTLAVAAVYNFVMNYNEFAFALTLLRSGQVRTLPLGIMEFADSHGTDITATAAAITLAVIPVFLLFIIAQRQMISGLTAGAVKG